MDQLPLFSLGGYESVTLEQGDLIDAIVSSAVDQPIIARLYDMNGVLLGEDGALGAESEREEGPGWADAAEPPDSGRTAGRRYLLQVAPAFAVAPAGV